MTSSSQQQLQRRRVKGRRRSRREKLNQDDKDVIIAALNYMMVLDEAEVRHRITSFGSEQQMGWEVVKRIISKVEKL
jgi:hypothetical protein